MRLRILFSALLFTVAAATNVWAADDDSFSSYESIVNELNAAANDKLPTPQTDWEEVAVQGGMSLVTSYMNLLIEWPGVSMASSGLLTGFEGHVGSNLFSRSVRGELAFRAFIPKELSGVDQVNMKEFEGRLAFLPRLQDRMRIRMGFGLGARFIDVEGRVAGGSYARSSSGVASSIFLGFERRLSPTVVVGPDVAYRASMNSDSLDKSSWDAAIRLNASF